MNSDRIFHQKRFPSKDLGIISSPIATPKSGNGRTTYAVGAQDLITPQWRSSESHFKLPKLLWCLGRSHPSCWLENPVRSSLSEVASLPQSQLRTKMSHEQYFQSLQSCPRIWQQVPAQKSGTCFSRLMHHWNRKYIFILFSWQILNFHFS